MSAKTYIRTVWVIAQSEAMAWDLLKRSRDYYYTDLDQARQDFAKVQDRAEWTKGKPWQLFTLTFAVTFSTEGG